MVGTNRNTLLLILSCDHQMIGWGKHNYWPHVLTEIKMSKGFPSFLSFTSPFNVIMPNYQFWM